MTKKVSVRIAGQERIEEVTLNENTTAEDILRKLALPTDGYELSPGSGIPPFGKDERIFGRVKDGGKIIAGAVAIAGVKEGR